MGISIGGTDAEGQGVWEITFITYWAFYYCYHLILHVWYKMTEPCRLVCWPKPLDRATMNLSHPEIQRHKSKCAVSRHLLVSKTPSLTGVKKDCSWEVLIK